MTRAAAWLAVMAVGIGGWYFGILSGVLTTTDLMMSLQCTLQILTKLADELREPDALEEPACA